jgi:hypothetical protein
MMANFVGTIVDDANFANQNFLKFLKDTLTTDTDWDILRYNDAIEPRELIVKGKGYSGTESIYVGFRSYQSTTADYYNLSVASFTGYVSGNSFDTQPGYTEMGLCAHNLEIVYWVNISPQRITFGLKVGTPIYESAYVGKFFPFATTSQYPYPTVCFGMFVGLQAIRYSDTSRSFGFRGGRTNGLFRNAIGTWASPAMYPWNANGIALGSISQRDTDTEYYLNPILVMDSGNIYGQLEGVYHITGFNNIVENTLLIDSKDYVVIQDVHRTGFADYIAIEVTV